MTKTKRFLDALAAGPHTMEGLAEELEMDIEQVRRAIWSMRFHGYIDTRPETYALSAKGTVRQMVRPKTPKAVLDKKAKQRRERRKDSSGLVEMAIRTQPTSVFNLGAQL
jgi:hypothetical protein